MYVISKRERERDREKIAIKSNQSFRYIWSRVSNKDPFDFNAYRPHKIIIITNINQQNCSGNK